MKKGNTILFENEKTHEQIETMVHFVHHYPDIRIMLETEGIFTRRQY